MKSQILLCACVHLLYWLKSLRYSEHNNFLPHCRRVFCKAQAVYDVALYSPGMPPPKDAPSAPPPAAAAGVGKSSPSSRGSPRTPGGHPAKAANPVITPGLLGEFIHRVNITAAVNRLSVTENVSRAASSGTLSPPRSTEEPWKRKRKPHKKQHTFSINYPKSTPK